MSKGPNYMEREDSGHPRVIRKDASNKDLEDTEIKVDFGQPTKAIVQSETSGSPNEIAQSKQGLNFEFTSKKTLKPAEKKEETVQDGSITQQYNRTVNKESRDDLLQLADGENQGLNSVNDQDQKRKIVDFAKNISDSQLIEKSLLGNDSKMSRVDVKQLLRPKIVGIPGQASGLSARRGSGERSQQTQ